MSEYYINPCNMCMMRDCQCEKREIDRLRAHLAACREALEAISAQAGMTNLGSCCVDKTCQAVWDDGEKLAHCAFQFGVARGFNESAHVARTALARLTEDGGKV